MSRHLARLRETGDPRIAHLDKLVELTAFRRGVCIRDGIDPATDPMIRALQYVLGLLLDDMIAQPEYGHERH